MVGVWFTEPLLPLFHHKMAAVFFKCLPFRGGILFSIKAHFLIQSIPSQCHNTWEFDALNPTGPLFWALLLHVTMQCLLLKRLGKVSCSFTYVWGCAVFSCCPIGLHFRWTGFNRQRNRAPKSPHWCKCCVVATQLEKVSCVCIFRPIRLSAFLVAFLFPLMCVHLFLSVDVCLCTVYMSCWVFLLCSHPPWHSSRSVFLCYVFLILLFNPPRPWRRTSSGWNMTSRERPMWGQFWPECYGWRSSWTKPIRPAHGSTMRTIQMVSQRDSGQWALTTVATRGNRLSQQGF